MSVNCLVWRQRRTGNLSLTHSLSHSHSFSLSHCHSPSLSLTSNIHTQNKRQRLLSVSFCFSGCKQLINENKAELIASFWCCRKLIVVFFFCHSLNSYKLCIEWENAMTVVYTYINIISFFFDLRHRCVSALRSLKAYFWIYSYIFFSPVCVGVFPELLGMRIKIQISSYNQSLQKLTLAIILKGHSFFNNTQVRIKIINNYIIRINVYSS